MEDVAEPSVIHRTYAVPRAGVDASEYEDASRVAAEAWPVSAAVADGATESAFARTWAELLVHGFTTEGAASAEGLDAVLSSAQSSWRMQVAEETVDRPWYVSAKAVEGAFATLLGLSVHEDGRWSAVAVGDSCLLHVRASRLIHSWPHDASDAFDHRPSLLPSRGRGRTPSPRVTSGRWESGDLFLLATDAAAEWLLEVGVPDVPTRTEAEFREAVQTARQDGALRNDDVTLTMLEVRSRPQPHPAASE